MLAFAPNNPDRKHKSVSVSRQALYDMRWDMLDGLFPKEVIDINSDAGLVHDALLNWGRVLRRREFIWAVKRALQNCREADVDDSDEKYPHHLAATIIAELLTGPYMYLQRGTWDGGKQDRTHCCRMIQMQKHSRGHNDCKAEKPRSAEIRPEILAVRPQHLIARHKAVAKLQEKPHSLVIQ